MANFPGSHCKNRDFEWAMAVALIGMGVLLVLSPTAVVDSKFQFMLDVVGSTTLMAAYLAIGSSRAFALYLNGDWPVWGPRVRAFTAIGGALVWLQMGLSLVIAAQVTASAAPPSAPLYFTLVLAELYSTYRAAADARYR